MLFALWPLPSSRPPSLPVTTLLFLLSSRLSSLFFLTSFSFLSISPPRPCLFLLPSLLSSLRIFLRSSSLPLSLLAFSPSSPFLFNFFLPYIPIRILSRPPFLSPPSFPPRLFPLPSFLALFSISPFYRAIIKRHVILNVSRRRNKSRIAKEREKRCEWKQG